MAKVKEIHDQIHLPDCGIWASEPTQAEYFATSPHRPSYHCILYIVSGEGECIIDEVSYELMPDTAVVISGATKYELINTPRSVMGILGIYFDDAQANRNFATLQPLVDETPYLIIPAHRARRIKVAAREILFEQARKFPGYQTAIVQSLSSIILEMYRTAIISHPDQIMQTAADSESRVRDVLQYVGRHYYEPLDLSLASKMAGLSRRQFTSLCRKLTQRSFLEYVNNVRIERATELLSSSDMPIVTIAFEIGYEELSTFYRVFKRLLKTSPLTFRRKHKMLPVKHVAE
jgi:AraC-like DNA-binding protein